MSFGDVEGFTTPALQTVTVIDGETTKATGSFSERGWLRVITSPAVVGTIIVDGVPRNDWGMWTDLPPGAYEVCFGDVVGYTAPGCQTASIAVGNTITITGTYN